MSAPLITCRVYRGTDEVHSEQRRAWNAGIRASESAVREIARTLGTVYHGSRPECSGERQTYQRLWLSNTGDTLRVEVTR